MFSNNPNILRLKLIALGVFSLISIGLVGWHFLYAEPARACEKGGGWWLNKTRNCHTPIYLPAITGRKPGEEGRTITWPTVDNPGRTASAPQAQAQSSASASAASPATKP